MTKYILSFGAGLAVGIGGAYLYLKGKFEEELSRQRQEIRDHYREKSSKDEEENKPLKVDQEHYQNIVRRYHEVENDLAEKESPPEDEPVDEIFVVTEDEIDSYVGYDNLSLTYYSGDDILCDDQEEVVEDPEAIVGDALTKFGMNKKYSDTLYVINNKIGAIFEILLVEGSYQEIVLGIKEGKYYLND